jgi:hypothetical protein
VAKWLSYVNLSDHYERKARFLPAALCVLPLLPASAAVGGPFLEWLKLLLGGAGIGAVAAVGFSHLASAMGNRFQRKLWPRWPYDSPTNRWLHPDGDRSGQQRALWYAAVKRLVGIEIGVAVAAGEDVEAVINDATAALRNSFWQRPEAERLRMHNVDFGFARNLTGMRPIWICFLLASTAVCWLSFAVMAREALLWAVVSSILALVLIPVGLWVLPGYVRTKATYYAESFFATLIAVDRAEATTPTQPPHS